MICFNILVISSLCSKAITQHRATCRLTIKCLTSVDLLMVWLCDCLLGWFVGYLVIWLFVWLFVIFFNLLLVGFWLDCLLDSWLVVLLTSFFDPKYWMVFRSKSLYSVIIHSLKCIIIRYYRNIQLTEIFYKNFPLVMRQS